MKILVKVTLILTFTGGLLLAAGAYFLQSRGRDVSELMVYARLMDAVDWDPTAPAEVGIESSQLAGAVSDILKRNTHALVLVKNDKLIFEWYREGYSRNSRFPLAAAAKPLVGALLLAINVEQGVVSLDQPVSDYLPEWKNDPVKRSITFRQVASHTSGLEDVPFRGNNGAYQKEKWKRDYEADPEKRFKYAQQDAGLLHNPAVEYSYSGVGYYIISYALTRARRQKGIEPDLRSLYKTKILDPLEIRGWGMSYGLAHRIDGMTLYSIGSGASLTARGMARTAQLIKNRGSYEGRSIINEQVVADVLRPVEVEKSREQSSGRAPVTAVGWYLNSNGFFKGLPADSVVGFGAGPEVVIICPSIDLIVVRTGQSLDGSSSGIENASSAYFNPIVAFFSVTS
ncbi:MAG: class C beta-lactamase-related serine hydrolase [Acidobacteria bacterium]|nr:MAG: class C beta-lactamase-related serine hydrolase [Acidobacteriota bacterium]